MQCQLAVVKLVFFVCADITQHVLAAGTKPTIAAITVQSPESIHGMFMGLYAEFGIIPSSPEEVFAWAPGHGSDGCAQYPSVPDSLAGRQFVAVARRGTCAFVLKAQQAQSAGARGIIVVSDSDEVQVMGKGNETSDGIKIFAVNVAKSMGDKIIEQCQNQVDVRMTFAVYKSLPMINLSEVVLVCLATSLVAAGAFFSTSDLRHGSPLAPRRDEVVEVTNEIAFGFCFAGSIMLVVLYFSMKYMIYFIIFGFCMGGMSCIIQLGAMSLQHMFPSLRQRSLQVPLCGPVGCAEIISFFPATLLVTGWLVFRNSAHGWIFQDIIGSGFLCFIQRTLRLPSFKIATLLLSIMFFFDVFWVFLSPLIFLKSVMVEVATGGGTGEAVPMLLRIPAFGDPFGRDRMLGFGDIALPGLLVAFLRRQDILAKRRMFNGYFGPSIIGYFCGLCVTLVALMVMQLGQPALLYLVPGTLGTTIVLSWRRGEFWRLWDDTLSSTCTRCVSLNNDSGNTSQLGHGTEVQNVAEAKHDTVDG